ncbi:hypothetical protein KIL84_009631 [Mauremys mutica]|uniref:Uncharacterized protein n=1 Tax=Mauremys mutica TaxID=74926 RepID=A0A9D3XLK8_9SAUR|nr:hypothetical protein KIL84_009631 [Mauremys mutica]
MEPELSISLFANRLFSREVYGGFFTLKPSLSTPPLSSCLPPSEHVQYPRHTELTAKWIPSGHGLWQALFVTYKHILCCLLFQPEPPAPPEHPLFGQTNGNNPQRQS